MNQDQNRRYSPQGSDQPREHREQRPYEQQRGGPSPGQRRGGPPPEEQPRQPPTGGPQGHQGGRHGSQQGSPMQGQRAQQGQQPPRQGQTGGQFGQGVSGRTDQPQQRQPPQTGRGQQQSIGGRSEQMGGQQPPQMGGQQRSPMGGQPQEQMGGRSQQTGGQPQQMGATGQSPGMQAGGSMQMGGTGTRQLPVEPVGAEDLAETDVVTADRDDPLTSIVEKMEENDVGTVVIAEDDRPVGIVTDRKIALAISERPDPSEMTAEDVMTEDPVTVSAEMSVFEVIQTLGDSGIRRAPIVDDDGKLTGIVSVDDMLVLLATELDQLGEIVERQIDRF